jgi:DNA-binding CsgD family transcriptional regulator
MLLEGAVGDADPEGPGLLVLAADLSLVSANGAADLLLAEVGDEDWPGRAELPSAVYGVVGGLLAQDARAAGGRALAPRSSLRTTSGRWVTLHASWLAGVPEPGGRQIAVVLETSAPARIWPHVAAAHRLSPRESDVTLLVVRGRSTREISDALRISEHTVQDNLKSVFDKVGVHSRGQLVAEIFGRHYR